MRVMVTCCPAPSHLYPVVPLAWALRAAGHRVLVVAPGNLRAAVVGAGLPFAASHPAATIVGAMLADRSPAGPADLAIGDHAMGLGFARLARAVLPGASAAAEWWRPDVVVTDPTAFEGVVVAAARGLPLVEHRWGLPIAPGITASARSALLAGAPVPWTPPSLVLDVCPPSFDIARGPRDRGMAYVPYNGAEDVEAWMHERAGPRVCVTLGTVLPNFPWAATTLSAVLDGLAALPVEVVVAVDPAAWQRLSDRVARPPNAVAVGRFPLDQVLPGCAAVVHHGGGGTTMTALARGVPQLVLPHFADQFANAAQVGAAGVGDALAVDGLTPAAVADRVTALVERPSFAARATAVAEEVAGQPPPGSVVPLLAELAAAATGAR
ncbi:nucleotide disphospho-sugar-binding domain-containing protein [Saccharothrix syringae]|nr:nucleotide disphospho-sugar-binding domain-containing protein [Saccharothrix syringae]